MPAPVTSVLTNFTGADENPLSEGGNWAATKLSPGAAGQLQRISNTCKSPTGASNQPWGATFAADQECFATVSTVPTATSDFASLWCRVQNPGTASLNGYFGGWKPGGSGTFQIYKVVNATFTSIGSLAAVALTAGQQLWLNCTGTTITLYSGSGGVWTQRVQVTDSAVTGAGQIGLEADDTTIVFDDFGGGALVTPKKSLMLMGVG